MPDHQGSDPIYVMGRSADETLRLQERARFFEPLTRHLFQDAGIRPGMSVLDIGSGPGDVSFLAAELVGPTGSVVGVDANPEVVRTAIRTAEASGLVQVSFIAGDIRDLALEREFDAVVGRLVLMYSADPSGTLRSALRYVRPHGLVAFHEMNIGTPVWSEPVSPLHQLLARCVSEAFARSGVEMAMGTRLYEVFVAAGVSSPQMCTDALIGAGDQWIRASQLPSVRAYCAVYSRPSSSTASRRRAGSGWTRSTSATSARSSVKAVSSSGFRLSALGAERMPNKPMQRTRMRWHDRWSHRSPVRRFGSGPPCRR
jgi:ubiquinone/menaquinone biosynthesis C-methylase UbiE